MRKKTIIYLGGFELPDRNAAAHRVVSNGKILRDLGYDVVFLGIEKTRVNGGLQRSTEDYFGFECWSMPYPRSLIAWMGYITSGRNVLDLLDRKALASCVAVICYNHPAVAQFKIRHGCRKIGVKHLVDATEWYDTSAGSPIYRLIKSIDVKLRMDCVHRLADGVITTSSFMTSYYTAQGKVVVELPTLFDATLFPAPARRDTSEVKHYIYVGVPFEVGRVNAQRTNLKERLDQVIELFYQMHKAGKDFCFDIYGINRSAYTQVFPEHAMKLDELNGKLSFHGRVPNAFVRDRIAQSDFSIFFRDESRTTLAGFPSKAAESITCGTPVIVNRMQSLERYCEAPGLLLAEPGREYELLEQCEAMPIVALENLKRHTFQARTFHYQEYKKFLADFLADVGIQ